MNRIVSVTTFCGSPSSLADREPEWQFVPYFAGGIMPFRYWAWFTLNEMQKVDTGECARLVQMYIPQIGHTSTWKPGERVVDVLERVGNIEPGTAVATFVKGRYPVSGHRHAAFYEGPVRSVTGTIMGIILLDQWNPPPGRADRPLIKRRTVERRGKIREDGTFPFISDNAEAFYVIEK
jgi:hypothetical protein